MSASLQQILDRWVGPTVCLILTLAEKLRRHILDETVLDYISGVVQEQERECDEAWVSQGDLHDFVAFLKACGGFEIR